jgi:hypothetical protein
LLNKKIMTLGTTDANNFAKIIGNILDSSASVYMVLNRR